MGLPGFDTGEIKKPSLMGKGVVVMPVWKIGLSVLLFIISSALSARFYQQYPAVELLGRRQVEDSALAAENISQ